MSDSPARFVWHELMTTDVESAKAFYAKVIGWSMQLFSDGSDYTVLSVGTKGVGGIMSIPPDACARGAPACWQGYIGVDDVDVCASRIHSTGGAIIKPAQHIPGVGRFAVVADPQGAVFIIFRPQGTDSSSALAPDTPGLIGWNELHAVDGLKAFSWYADVFGWTKVQDIDMGDMGPYRLFATGAGPVGGMMTKTPEMPQPFWACYFNVESIDAAIARTIQAGGKLLHGPQEVPGPAYIANCQDPQGAWFSMVAQRR